MIWFPFSFPVNCSPKVYWERRRILISFPSTKPRKPLFSAFISRTILHAFLTPSFPSFPRPSLPRLYDGTNVLITRFLTFSMLISQLNTIFLVRIRELLETPIFRSSHSGFISSNLTPHDLVPKVSWPVAQCDPSSHSHPVSTMSTPHSLTLCLAFPPRPPFPHIFLGYLWRGDDFLVSNDSKTSFISRVSHFCFRFVHFIMRVNYKRKPIQSRPLFSHIPYLHLVYQVSE